MPAPLIERELVAQAIPHSTTVVFVRPADEITVVPKVSRIPAKNGIEGRGYEDGLVRGSSSEHELLYLQLLALARVDKQQRDENHRHAEDRAL